MVKRLLWSLMVWQCHGTSGMLCDIIPARLNYNWLGQKVMRLGGILEVQKFRKILAAQEGR